MVRAAALCDDEGTMSTHAPPSLAAPPKAYRSTDERVLGGVALVVLGGFGWWHRNHTLPKLAAGRSKAFTRLATAELVVMLLTVAIAVALSRSPTPSPVGGPNAPPAAAVATAGAGRVP